MNGLQKHGTYAFDPAFDPAMVQIKLTCLDPDTGFNVPIIILLP